MISCFSRRLLKYAVVHRQKMVVLFTCHQLICYGRYWATVVLISSCISGRSCPLREIAYSLVPVVVLTMNYRNRFVLNYSFIAFFVNYMHWLISFIYFFQLKYLFPLYKDCIYNVREATTSELTNFLRPLFLTRALDSPSLYMEKQLPELPKGELNNMQKHKSNRLFNKLYVFTLTHFKSNYWKLLFS